MSKSDHKVIIPSLQGVRAAAFLGIFLNHSLSGAANLGAGGVSMFLVLSGFLMTYSYWDRPVGTERPTLLDCLRFAWHKVRPLYGLHLLTLTAMLGLDLILSKLPGQKLSELLCRVGLSVLLLQAWVPSSSFYFSLNAVAWYLSTAFFSYFIFLPLLRHLKERRPIQTVLMWIGLDLAAIAAVSALAYWVGDPVDSAWFSRHWITYVLPLSRALDFCLGALVGVLFVRHSQRGEARTSRPTEQRSSFLFGTAMELAALGLFAMALLTFYRVSTALRYTALFVLPTLCLIPIIAIGRGAVSRLLLLGPVRRIGDLSGYAFLLHLPAIRVSSLVLQKAVPSAPKLLEIVLSLMATLGVSALFRRLNKLCRK